MGRKMTIAEIEATLGVFVPMCKEHDKILVRGNGEPSLQEHMRTVLKFIKEEEESRKFWSRLVLGALATNMIGLGVAAFMWFVKIYPVIERLSREVAVK